MAQIVIDQLKQWGDNFTHNTTSAFADMGPKDYIRLVIIIGTYLLIRPHIMKFGMKMQQRAHEKDAIQPTDADIHPNELRGGKKVPKVAIPGVDSDSDEEEAKPGDWGKKARVRQRKFIRREVERKERELEDESDKEIEEYLVD